ncbi:MAG: CRTAC1 family protein [Planctomycetota bacterium]|nr:CRTAC1 family protein [Planctomycetota bacterium]
MAGRAHRTTLRGLALCLALISTAACKPKEAPPDFLGKAASKPSGEKKEPGPLDRVMPTGTSVIDLKWLSGAIPEAIVRTGREQGNLFLPETTGGGIAALDFDRDGWTDIACVGGGYADVANRMMLGYGGSLHRGRGENRFEHVSALANFDLSGRYSAGIAVADYDADGFLDLWITGYSIGQLLRNQGDGTFETIDVQSIGLEDPHWGASAAFFDANADGLLDLYVANYADWSFDNNPVCGADARSGKSDKSSDYCGPREFKGLADVLYENLGDGSYRNVSKTAGIEDQLRGLGVIAADLDSDGDVDLYISNDVDPNLLYRNEGDFKFTEVARQSGVATNDLGTPEGSMGIAYGDYNLDGFGDLWVTNYQNEINALYRSNGQMQFQYASVHARIAQTDEATVGWGTAFADLDCDGDEDLVVVNGHIELMPLGSTSDQRPQILENLSGKTFQLVPRKNTYLQTAQGSRGLAMADFNRDGKLDFVVSRMHAEAAVVLNTTVGGNALRVRLIGTRSNRDAIGSRVELLIGKNRWMRQLVGGGSYASANDSLIHFGVPQGVLEAAKTESPEDPKIQVEVFWPSGTSERWILANFDQEWLLIEGQSPE